MLSEIAKISKSKCAKIISENLKNNNFRRDKAINSLSKDKTVYSETNQLVFNPNSEKFREFKKKVSTFDKLFVTSGFIDDVNLEYEVFKACDAIIFCASSGKTRINTLKSYCDLFSEEKDKFIGFILID